METYIAILRGINVGGRKPLKMDDLKRLFEESGFKNVQTYIQSGNVVFQSNNKLSSQETGQKISAKIRENFDYEVPVLVMHIERLKEIIAKNPFAEDLQKDISHLHVTFLAAKPEDADQRLFQNIAPNEVFAVTDDAVFLYCPDGYSKSKITNDFCEKKLKVSATTRNWKTTKRLLEIALKYE